MISVEQALWEEYLNFIKSEIPSWAMLDYSSVNFELLTGTSNKVYKLWNSKEVQPTSLLLRIFGPNEITDKIREHQIFLYLGKHNLAPKAIGLSPSARIEEFLENYLPIVYEDLLNPKIIKNICDKIRQVHQLEGFLSDEGNILFENLSKWRKIGIEKIDLIENPVKKASIEDLLSQNMWARFLEIVPNEKPESIVHLDLNFYNILLNRQTESIYLVDYEFTGNGDRSLDFSFLFSDMRFDYLYDKPPYFSYLKEKAPTDELIAEYVKAYGEGSDFWIDIKRGILVANYIWAIWGVAIWKNSGTGFDYLENALLRFSEFIQESEDYWLSGGKSNLENLAQRLFYPN